MLRLRAMTADDDLPDPPETPTAEGCRRYPPHGFKGELACTCEGCPEPCDGAFCGCSACYNGHELLDHPTHHRPFAVVCGIATVITLLFLFPLGGLLGSFAWPAGIFFTMLIGILIWAFRFARHCRCAVCGALLTHDTRSPRGRYFYFCPDCNIVWESRLKSS